MTLAAVRAHSRVCARVKAEPRSCTFGQQDRCLRLDFLSIQERACNIALPSQPRALAHLPPALTEVRRSRARRRVRLGPAGCGSTANMLARHGSALRAVRCRAQFPAEYSWSYWVMRGYGRLMWGTAGRCGLIVGTAGYLAPSRGPAEKTAWTSAARPRAAERRSRVRQLCRPSAPRQARQVSAADYFLK